MPNYVLVYHGGGVPESEEEGQRIMAAWMKWFEDIGDSVVDAGNPVSQVKTVASDGSVSAGGGPNPVTGYTVVSADSMDDAVEMSKGCPILHSGGSVEVGETFKIM
jgi:hypothetical protein